MKGSGSQPLATDGLVRRLKGVVGKFPKPPLRKGGSGPKDFRDLAPIARINSKEIRNEYLSHYLSG
ncbi:hypothetical protein MicloDRAFT_00007150 [Microvirga lotononidis]|uniref:Uncharacterized protein n=1 Tax=Microvirga lotononidis TaxID=864069 RepID=I4Z2M4_9HYPH|nr:hypothetical protein MicloDRAFT_00007150 [Microvirga lotononidis]